MSKKPTLNVNKYDNIDKSIFKASKNSPCLQGTQKQTHWMKGYKVSMMDGGKAKIELVGPITWWENSSSDFSTKVKALEQSGATEIEIYINSPGGSVFDANEIVNILKSSSCRKSLAKIGALCASAATIVALAFDKIAIAENGMFMIHDPYMDVWDATEKKLKSSLDMLSQLKVGMVKAYMAKSGNTEEEILQMMDLETWMSAGKAVEQGFVDSVDGVAGDEEQTEMMAGVRSFKYKHLPVNYTSQNKSESNMKSVKMALGLPDTSSEQDVEKAVTALLAERDSLMGERAEALVDAAIEAKKITAGDREQWVKDAKANYPLAKRLFGAMQSVAKVSDQTQPTSRAPQPKSKLEQVLAKDDLSFDDLLKDAEVLDAVRENHPDTYAKLYKDKFGLDCVFED